MPSRRQYLAALGTGGAALGVGAVTGVVTVPRVSPAWTRWQTGLNGVGRHAVLDDGRLYLTGRSSLVALDAETGERRWSARLDREPRYGVAADERSVFAGNRALVAFAPTGTERWRRRLDEVVPDARDGERLSAVPLPGGPLVVAVSGRRSVVAFDATDGSLRWTTPLDGDIGRAVRSGDRVVVPVGTDGGSDLVALDTTDGAERWRRSFDERAGDLAVDGDVLVYARSRGGGGGLTALDVASGTVRWERSTTASAVSVAAETVYGVAGEPDRTARRTPTPRGEVFALVAATGRRRWRTAGRDYPTTAPTRGGGAVYVGTELVDDDGHHETGALSAFGADGRRQFTHGVGRDHHPTAPPVVGTRGRVYLVTDESVVALQKR